MAAGLNGASRLNTLAMGGKRGVTNAGATSQHEAIANTKMQAARIMMALPPIGF